jgi:thiamine kinase-like enzyme
MSNLVFSVECDSHEEVSKSLGFDGRPSRKQKYLLRIYGDNIDRTVEEAIAIALGLEDVAPKVLSVFANGRLEEFVDNTAVRASEFRHSDTASVLVQNLASIHGLLPVVMGTGHYGSAPTDAFWSRLASAMSDSSRAAEALKKNDNLSSQIAYIESCGAFDDAVIQRAKVWALDSRSPLVFGHCDLHHGNVLRSTKDGSLVVIDFEYSIPTSRGFDLANFMCEFCSDYDSHEPHELNYDLFPCDATRVHLIRSYLSVHANDCTSRPVPEVDREIMAYLPFVHLFWAHWALVKYFNAVRPGGSSASSSAAFDYLRYATQRFEQWGKLMHVGGG